MLLDSSAYRDIYLIFMNADYKMSNILKDGFKHVYAIERQSLGWICIDPSTSDLYCNILPATYAADVIKEFKLQNPECTILNIHIKPHQKKIYPFFGLLSCVSVMQYLLGVNWPFVLTPYQLYTKLIKNTCDHIEVINGETHSS